MCKQKQKPNFYTVVVVVVVFVIAARTKRQKPARSTVHVPRARVCVCGLDTIPRRYHPSRNRRLTRPSQGYNKQSILNMNIMSDHCSCCLSLDWHFAHSALTKKKNLKESSSAIKGRIIIVNTHSKSLSTN